MLLLGPIVLINLERERKEGFPRILLPKTLKKDSNGKCWTTGNGNWRQSTYVEWREAVPTEDMLASFTHHLSTARVLLNWDVTKGTFFNWVVGGKGLLINEAQLSLPDQLLSVNLTGDVRMTRELTLSTKYMLTSGTLDDRGSGTRPIHDRLLNFTNCLTSRRRAPHQLTILLNFCKFIRII
jgi:hypothetical protein